MTTDEVRVENRKISFYMLCVGVVWFKKMEVIINQGKITVLCQHKSIPLDAAWVRGCGK